MLIIDDRKFVLTKFDTEDELERVVVANAEYIFGPSSIYLPKISNSHRRWYWNDTRRLRDRS